MFISSVLKPQDLILFDNLSVKLSLRNETLYRYSRIQY